MAMRKITYTVREVVIYVRTAEIPDDVADAAMIDALLEDWAQSGDPVENLSSVEDQQVTEWESVS